MRCSFYVDLSVPRSLNNASVDYAQRISPGDEQLRRKRAGPLARRTRIGYTRVLIWAVMKYEWHQKVDATCQRVQNATIARVIDVI